MMKKILPLLFGLMLFFGSSPATAQFSDIGDALRAGAEDAETIMRAYLKPIPSGLGADINSGWTNRAKPHGTLGFDIQVRAALSFIPKSDQTFDLNDLDLQKVRPADPNQTIAPTVGGDSEIGPKVIVEEDGEQVADFNLPEGSGYSFVPAPMVQAGLGTVKDTDLIVRYMPEVTIDETKFNMYGFGLKHGINQWLPGGNLLPVNISIMGGFTKIDLDSNFDLRPEQGAIPNPENPDAAQADFDDQEADISLNTFTLKALVGKNLPFISVYGGVGYESSTMDVNVEGQYPVSGRFNGIEVYDVVEDPFTYNADGQNKFSLLGGVTLKMAVFHIFGEFSLSKYSTANAGIGFSFR
ncbi:DUF6588 family protein [Fodinibius salsisoli]|uniref:Outer membrane protein beta-barrel domain-containing protein n=1 Tax=Fodinibius salsisoli TaxID=2820877 RepID=A0ABT3PN17_9BACT|nr:DUF6588 family protein [Fodinibius salsisoli]MCW9707326.1 hypothetical protein [Fodinibius salsisoli]